MLRVDVPGIGESGVSTITECDGLLLQPRRFRKYVPCFESLIWSPAITPESISVIFGSTLFTHYQTHIVCTYGQN